LRRREPERESQTVIKVGPDFYILASSLTSRRETRVLVNGESFAVFEVGGDILESPLEPLGFFHRDTRYMSRFELKVAGEVPYYLNSYVSSENAQMRVNLSSPDMGFESESVGLAPNSIQIERNWVIAGAVLFHKLTVRNYAHRPVQIPLDFLFGVDFADLFEVRGLKRAHHGVCREPEIAANRVRFSSRGLDNTWRFTEIVFDPEPAVLEASRASFGFALKRDEQQHLEVRIATACERIPTTNSGPSRFKDALAQRRAEIASLDAGWTRLTTSSEPLNSLLSRSASDLTSLVRWSPEGTFIMAGIPWFATLFGRDSIITALFTLPFNPEIAAGTLKTLAGLQGAQVDQMRDEQPGKIVHEIRGGEMAAAGEVPFGRYYGSIDGTPLFLLLLARYVRATGDLGLAELLWNNVEWALQWIEQWGDRDGDLFVEYLRQTPRGLANQGWKDSFDAISHADGSLARPPIALCEVQAYVYAAYQGIADVAAGLGRESFVDRLRERAEALQSAFVRDFWLEKEGTIALALDAHKKPCRVMASNAGHCLAVGLLDRQRAHEAAAHLMDDEMFSGWGIRTLGCKERLYNPMSYHNGSIWPHDNAIVAAGLSRAGHRGGVLRILEGLLDASVQLKTGSLPELFCGFPRDERLGPVPYPVACHPQAWSAASLFMILQAMLGIEVMGFDRKLVINSPIMPAWLDWIKIENLRVGAGVASLLVRRTPEVPAIEILEKRGRVTVEIR
jgi:glycogen debranching enzyme